MEDWASVATDVAAALGEVGFAATLQRPNTGPQTPFDGVSPVAGPMVPVTLFQKEWGWGHVDGTRIQATDKRWLMSSAVTPTPADRIIMPGDAVPYRIIRVRAISPGNVNLMFEIQARK